MATEYDFSKAHETLTRWLHYGYCGLPVCQDKGVNDPPCDDESFHFKAAFMTAAMAPHFMKEINSGGREIEDTPCCVD